MEYTFKGIGPQPPEVVIFNRNEFSSDQVRDAVNAYQLAREHAANARRKIAAAGLAQQARARRIAAEELAFPFSENVEYDIRPLPGE